MRIRSEAVGRGVVAGLVLALLAGAGFPAAGIAASGQARSWITIATVRPGIGCSVAVGIEVRSDGEPLTGVSVAIAFFGSDSDPLSTDQASTGGDGVAELAFDTSDASPGVEGWLDVNIDGAYVGGTSIQPAAAGGCAGAPVELRAEAAVSPSAGTTGEAGPDAVLIAGVPEHKQIRSLSCEYASVQIATAAFGDPLLEADYLDSIPQADNPHFGYRGDIDGEWGNTDDYGIYAEALVPNLEAHGYVAEVSYGADAETLRDQLDAGHPTVVWIATRGDTGFYAEDADGNQFKLVPYEHVVVAYGYDDDGVYVSDPGNGSYGYYSWDWFLDAWNVMDGMALSVYPAS